MRSKSILLLVLIAVSVTFVTFLLLESQSATVTCEKSPACINPDTGVLASPENHLIVSIN